MAPFGSNWLYWLYNDWRNANTPGSGDFIYGGNGTKILKPELRVVWLIYILQIVLLLYLSYKGEGIFTEQYLKSLFLVENAPMCINQERLKW